MAFADEQKGNAHEQIAFADEQKRNAREEIPFPDSVDAGLESAFTALDRMHVRHPVNRSNWQICAKNGRHRSFRLDIDLSFLKEESTRVSDDFWIGISFL